MGHRDTKILQNSIKEQINLEKYDEIIKKEERERKKIKKMLKIK